MNWVTRHRPQLELYGVVLFLFAFWTGFVLLCRACWSGL